MGSLGGELCNRDELWIPTVSMSLIQTETRGSLSVISIVS